MECFRLLFDHLAWIEHQILSGIRDSRKTGSLWGMVRGVGGVRKSVDQSWLAKGLGLGLLCWGLREFRKRFRRKRPSLFKSAQWHFCRDNAPVHNCILVTDYLTKMGIKTIEEMKEAMTKVIDMLTQEDFHGAFQKFLERSDKCIAAGGDYFEGD